MESAFLTLATNQVVACQWFLIGLTSGIAGGMILSVLMRWLTDTHH